MHIVGLPFHAKAMHYNNVTCMEVTENCFDPSNNPPRCVYDATYAEVSSTDRRQEPVYGIMAKR